MDTSLDNAFGHIPMIFDKIYNPSWRKFQLLFNFCMDICIKFKLHVKVHVRQRDAQVMFRFGFGPLIFDRFVPLELKKKKIL
jgi:hypothetical protein